MIYCVLVIDIRRGAHGEKSTAFLSQPQRQLTIVFRIIAPTVLFANTNISIKKQKTEMVKLWSETVKVAVDLFPIHSCVTMMYLFIKSSPFSLCPLFLLFSCVKIISESGTRAVPEIVLQ